jgi:hypothetical protein
MKHERLNRHSQIYVSACGQQFTSAWLGREHELSCMSCRRQIDPEPDGPCIKWDDDPSRSASNDEFTE